ncbi:MAG: sugar ABC transporter permease [Bacilli bacterium]|jgi:arabinogalactan oligomer/maltooligosaccharide transport system permease protein
MKKKTKINEKELLLKEEGGHLNFANVSALANVDVQPVGKFKTFLLGLLNTLLKSLIWLGAFLLDILKAFANIFVSLYKGIVFLIKRFVSFFKKHIRHFYEVDRNGKTSYFIMGFSSIKSGQIVNGIFYMLVQVGFILFMVFFGWVNLWKLTGPGLIPFTPPGVDEETGLYTAGVEGDSSIKCLLYGLLTVILIFVFIYLYIRNLNTASHNDKIVHGPKYVDAYEDQINFIEKINENIYLISNKGDEKAKRIRFLSKRKRYKVLLENGYETLSARFINYLSLKKLVNAPHEVLDEAKFNLNKFHQIYDRYNVFNDVNKAINHLLFAYENSELVLDAIYARDELSKRNNLSSIDEKKRIKKKEAITRIVGALNVEGHIAETIFDLGLHNKKITKEAHQKKYDRLVLNSKAFNERYANKYYGQTSTFKKQTQALFNENFATTVLFLPVTFATILVIIPLAFTIFVAFTNFNGANSGLNLFKWVGFDNFITLFAGKGANEMMSRTIWTLLSWTLIWAFFATFLNYVLGMILALLINRKGIKLKKLWRTIFVVTIAVPQFVSLLAMSKILGDYGPLNEFLMTTFNLAKPIKFLSDGNIAKFTVIIVNCWVGVPYTMLITSGILMNIPEDLYESARIDGAGPFTQFIKITLPYMLFVTGPYLITQFIGNINNFNVIFFLTGSQPNKLYLYNANDTDLLITWLYKITTGSGNQYNVASTLGIFIFAISAFLSLIMYARIGSVQKEEDFQ